MEIPHATLDQVRTGRNGKKIMVSGDVLGVVKQIQELDPRLKVYWNEFGEHYVITERLDDGTEGMVTTIPPDGLNSALVEYLRFLASSENDYIGDAERKDRQADREKDRALEEQVGEMGERMAYQIRRDDVEVNAKAFIPRGVS
jgi:hypothetical protein